MQATVHQLSLNCSPVWKRILNYYFVWFCDIVYQNNLFVLKKLEKLLHENQNRKSLSDPVNNLLWYVFENVNHDIKQNNKTYNLHTYRFYCTLDFQDKLIHGFILVYSTKRFVVHPNRLLTHRSWITNSTLAISGQIFVRNGQRLNGYPGNVERESH